MKVFVINGTSFVGKSTALRLLHDRLPGKCAVMDGDDVGRVRPFELSREWLDLIQDNILSCALNFDAAGVEYFLFAFPFPGPNRTGRLTSIFESRGYTLNWVNLIASDTALEQRFRLRGGTKPQNLQLGIDMNRTIAQTTGCFALDTTHLSPEEVASVVLERILKESQAFGAVDTRQGRPRE
ncbi:MAG: hypothetical protein GF331_25655 [Chitinivibrionales bacterium]|nr:hypothetical protein [Chitinivibrionales bacterium]